MSLRHMLWRLDRDRMRVVWVWTSSGVECRALGREDMVGVGSNGVEALRALLGER